ncbi:hypothetical protein C0992_009462 [Termitomyces sp. T32_za158]|nr:hypothetical protein C0992_009462 [Termitomyces sp. T32_za158]
MPMTTRLRRARVLRSDIQIDSDVDIEKEEDRDRPRRRGQRHRKGYEPDDEEHFDVDIETVAEKDEDEDEEVVEEEEEDDEIQSDTDGVPKVNLKIRLKLPATNASSRYETPTVESEDSIDSQPRRKRPLTSRQAVLANVIDPSHVSLGSSRQKKIPPNETELALRREETARKRKNLNEKKLEDEKVCAPISPSSSQLKMLNCYYQLETINRLLRKQSRPRKKRNTAQRTDMDDIAPAEITHSNSNSVYTPFRLRKDTKKSNVDDEQYDDECEEEEAMGEEEEAAAEEDEAPEKEVQVPTMYRWVSTSRITSLPDSKESADGAVSMQITFSIPTCALPQTDENKTTSLLLSAVPVAQPLPRPTTCAMPGCDRPFRYRLVKDCTRGACGISCLKQLEASVDISSL